MCILRLPPTRRPVTFRLPRGGRCGVAIRAVTASSTGTPAGAAAPATGWRLTTSSRSRSAAARSRRISGSAVKRTTAAGTRTRGGAGPGRHAGIASTIGSAPSCRRSAAASGSPAKRGEQGAVISFCVALLESPAGGRGIRRLLRRPRETAAPHYHRWLGRGAVQVRRGAPLQGQRDEMASARQPVRAPHPAGASALPTTARSGRPDRVNPDYRFWHCHPPSPPPSCMDEAPEDWYGNALWLGRRVL